MSGGGRLLRLQPDLILEGRLLAGSLILSAVCDAKASVASAFHRAKARGTGTRRVPFPFPGVPVTNVSRDFGNQSHQTTRLTNKPVEVG